MIFITKNNYTYTINEMKNIQGIKRATKIFPNFTIKNPISYIFFCLEDKNITWQFQKIVLIFKILKLLSQLTTVLLIVIENNEMK